MLRLLEMTSAQLPSSCEEYTDDSKEPPEVVQHKVVKFSTMHHSSSQEFDLDYNGFWLICLLEVGRE